MSLIFDENFKNILTKDQDGLKKYVYKFLKDHYKKVYDKPKFVYAKGNIPVMLVAHLDTVHKQIPKYICYSEDGIIMSPQGIGGDDRCGVYIITRLIESGYEPYVLFTCDEETGGVGAGHFISDSLSLGCKFKFIIEFDRKGANDCVFYDCENIEFTEWVEDFGFKESWGSYSDIDTIAPVIGCAAVNLSSGYYEPHNKNEYININDVESTINRAAKMLDESRFSPYFKYIKSKYSGYSYYGSEVYYNKYYGSYSTQNKNTNYFGPTKNKMLMLIDEHKHQLLFDGMKIGLTNNQRYAFDSYLKVYYKDEKTGLFGAIPQCKVLSKDGCEAQFKIKDSFSAKVKAYDYY